MPCTLHPQSSTLHHRPSTLNPQPSTLKQQPSTRDPQPSTLNPQPSTLDPGPLTLNPHSQVLNPHPPPITPDPRPTPHTLSLKRVSLRVGPNELAENAEAEDESCLRPGSLTPKRKPRCPFERRQGVTYATFGYDSVAPTTHKVAGFCVQGSVLLVSGEGKGTGKGVGKDFVVLG